MDVTVYKIALAAYFHDIGKFAERAVGTPGVDQVGFFPNKEFLNNNMGLYLPSFKGKYTHMHALYTAAFIDSFEKLLPEEFNKEGWGLGDSFINLASGHHKPETPLQWLIAIADRISSGFDRTEFEKYNTESDDRGIPLKDYKKTRLLTIFEGLSIDDKLKSDSLDDYEYRYPLKELSPESIFPVSIKNLGKMEVEKASEEYRQLFSNFINALEKLSHKEYIPLWFEHLDSLFMIFCSHIPAATVGNVIPDVSLYDHCRTTSAIASALYKYHEETNTLTVDAIKNYEPTKFLIISGDFYGIQDFIFTEGGSTGKASAKILRGRSFYVSLLSELAADMLCRELNLPVTSIVLNAAGKFTVLAYNTHKAKEKVKEIEEKINDWLIRNFFGQSSMGFSIKEASPNDFVKGNFLSLYQRLLKEVNRRKYSKFDLLRYSGCISTYLDSFDSELGVCPFCGKRPAKKEAKVKEEYSCKICHDQIFIGENLVKKEQIAVLDKSAEIHNHEKILEPIFGIYQIVFPAGKLTKLVKDAKVYKFWNIEISENGQIAKNITAKFINGYIPKFEDEDLTEDAINKILAGKKSEKLKEELFDSLQKDIPKTFSYIAKMSLNISEDGKFKGVEALGALKADVDNLGLLFSFGIKRDRFTISRLATLSRQLNNYFTIFLPFKLKTHPPFKNIYTVFAGGDDLFLIGPWNRIIELAGFLNKTFKDYVCKNEDITISAGISIHKPSTPVLTIAENSEEALDASKARGRDRVTIFGETAKWTEFSELEKIKFILQKWLHEETINSAMLYRFNEFIEMRKKEEYITKSKGEFSLEEMECLKWRSMLYYTLTRNIGAKGTKEEKQNLINEVLKIYEWLQSYGEKLKIPLWQVIYNNRKVGG